jgi:uncharacterized membrane protein YeiH
MQYVLEHFAVAVCAVTGVLAGKGKRLDLFGVVVLALVTALGGGTFRDLVLGVSPIFWIKDPYYVHTALIAAVATFVAVRFWEFPEGVLLVADAFGLALFTMLGTEKSVAHGASATISICLGVVTGVGGGMMRDVLTGEIPLVFRKEIYLYATAAAFGAGLFILLGHLSPANPWNRILAAGAILALRLTGIRWRITLPLFLPVGTRKEKAIESVQTKDQESGGAHPGLDRQSGD